MSKISDLLALQSLKQATRSAQEQPVDYSLVGWDGQSGQIVARRSDGAIVSAEPALISNLGIGERGIAKDGFFV